MGLTSIITMALACEELSLTELAARYDDDSDDAVEPASSTPVPAVSPAIIPVQVAADKVEDQAPANETEPAGGCLGTQHVMQGYEDEYYEEQEDSEDDEELALYDDWEEMREGELERHAPAPMVTVRARPWLAWPNHASTPTCAHPAVYPVHMPSTHAPMHLPCRYGVQGI